MNRATTLPIALTVLIASAVLPAATGAQPRDVASRVTAVTVYADRARVTRGAEIDLDAEARAFTLAALPGWIDEGSVRVSLEPAGSGQILGVQIHRTYLARPGNDEFRAAEEAVQEIADQLAVLADEEAVLGTETQHIESVRAFSVDKMPRDAAARRVDTSEYQEAVAFVGDSLRRVAKARRELAGRRRQLEPELEARKRRLADLRQRAQLEQRSIVVTADADGPLRASLAVTYMIPGATWEPVHELRVDGGAGGVALASFAHVQQTTGEDWEHAKVSLATQRSDETLRIPEIEALHLGGGRSLSRWVASSRETFDDASESYAKQNVAFFITRNADLAQQRVYMDNQQIQLDNARRVAEVFRSLEQRGTTAHFAALGPQTVPSDGSRARVPIGSMQPPADRRILAAPELSLNAVRILDLANRGAQPLLPGKVSLYVDGAFLGLTDLGFIAPGEDFELFLGVADHLKLSRAFDEKRSALSRRGSRTKMSVSFLLRIENLSDRGETVQLRDRVPISQTDQIRVSGVRVSPEGQPDTKGLLSWTVSLAPRETREYHVEYTIEYPTGLPATALEGGRAEEQMLRHQLRELESRMQG